MSALFPPPCVAEAAQPPPQYTFPQPPTVDHVSHLNLLCQKEPGNHTRLHFEEEPVSVASHPHTTFWQCRAFVSQNGAVKGELPFASNPMRLFRSKKEARQDAAARYFSCMQAAAAKARSTK